MEPALTTTWAVQNAIVDDLRRNAVRYVVRYSGFSADAALAPTVHNERATLLDEFIRANYQPVATFDSYSIWSRA